MTEQSSAYETRTFKEDKIAWYLLICFVLALVWGIRLFRENDRVQLRVWKNVVSKRATITILEFDRVVLNKNTDHIYQLKLKEQLDVLEKDGFEAVTVSDVYEFYFGGKKLPEKAVLLNFANGYLETYVVVDPILRQMKWPAAMTINVETVDKKETFFLYWDRLQRMVNSGVWSLVSDGKKRGEMGTNLKKVSAEKTLADYKVSRDLVEANIPGYKLLAHSSKFYKAHNYIINNGAGDLDEPALKNLYQLRFVNSVTGANEISSDPLRLRQLRVKPKWNPKTLLALMNQGVQALTASGADTIQEESTWFRNDGEMVETTTRQKLVPGKNVNFTTALDVEQGIRLQGVPGKGIFFPVRNTARNWVLETDIRLDRGEFWIRQPSPETGDGWRMGGNSQNINLQVRIDNGRYENLAGSRTGITLEKWHHLRLVKRGKGVLVDWDGHPLWDLPVSTPNKMNGDIGLWAWSEKGEGSLRLSEARISFFPDDIRWLKSYPKEDAVQFLIKQTKQISGVTTITHRVQGNHVEAVSFDKDLFQIISHRYGWDLIPTIQILPEKYSSGNHVSESDEENSYGETGNFLMYTIKELVKQNNWTQAHLDFSQVGGERVDEWFAMIVRIKNDLEKINCRLLVTSKGRPDVSQSLKFKLLLLKNDLKSNWSVAERSH